MNKLALSDLDILAKAHADAKVPNDIYTAVAGILERRIGFGLFTMLVVTPSGEEVERIYSSNPDAYPLAGRKRMGPTPWGEHVLRQKRPFLGRDVAAIRWAFPDHVLIESLGLGCVINIPILAFGRVLGTFNILDREGVYDESDMATALALSPYVVLPFMTELGQIAGPAT